MPLPIRIMEAGSGVDVTGGAVLVDITQAIDGLLLPVMHSVVPFAIASTYRSALVMDWVTSNEICTGRHKAMFEPRPQVFTVTKLQCASLAEQFEVTEVRSPYVGLASKSTLTPPLSFALVAMFQHIGFEPQMSTPLVNVVPSQFP